MIHGHDSDSDDYDDDDDGDDVKGTELGRQVRVFNGVTVVSNIIIFILHLGFGMYGYWNHGVVPTKSVFSAVTWFLASLVTIYSKNKAFRGPKTWPPLVLILWWVFSCIFVSFSVAVYVIRHLGLGELPHRLPEADFVDIASLPLLLFICCCFPLVVGKSSELERPLLLPEEEASSCRDDGNFSNASILSQLTFQWLNPLFEKGRIEKLELHHIPTVPESETAENASLLLEESLRKQKMQVTSLPKAITGTIWKSLAINAVFAGLNTIASYVGPFLISSFVNFLTQKNDVSSYQYGLVLAFIFFFSKTAESLTQRLWYFGAQRIGIRVRAALTTKVSFDRIQEFLGEEDQWKFITGGAPKESDVAIEMEAGEYAWDTSSQSLKNPTIKIKEKMKIMKDDPFSAVDAHTGTHLFNKCLKGLLSQKTVIYATHQLEFLDAADLVLVMKDGLIVQSGKYEELIADSDGELVRQMNAHRKSLDQVNHPPQDDDSVTARPCQISQIEVIEEKYGDPTCYGKLFDQSQEEETETGRVKWSVYSTFVTAAYKGALVPVILLCQVFFQGLQIGSNYWIAWATEENHKVSREQLIGIFVMLSGGSSIFILGRAVFLATIAIETAQRLFLGMITSVFRAPISFFDSTPSSRILSRSSTDQSTLDTDIPYRLAGLAFALIQLFSIIILMSHVAWQIFLLFVVILGISFWYQTYYITTARELARMVGIRKAPILHHFSESISGAGTIRCFNQEDRINFLFNFVFFLVLIILVSLPRSAIDPSLAGLAATYGLNLNVLQAWQHTDQQIWEVLNKCRLANIVRQDQRLLDAPVAEDGENWSVGQRQLVCLARETIRQETSRCTVITVAHRIPTVIDNDLVLVLDKGQVAEYDKPGKLLEDNFSSFSKLVAEFLRSSSKGYRDGVCLDRELSN
ncbi:hypothetical protein V6N11_007457 [Hibiscus sabdariffa]|uniref:Uncharacterized protein n=1 Tax=Hibiscus sabdariffa TaxID=183260 RepID=A0ABR2NS51_9ROSI